MKETLIRIFDAMTIRDEMILLAIIFVVAIVIWFVRHQIDIANRLYEAIQEDVSTDDHPEHNDLHALTTFRQFRKDMPEFKQAVLGKLQAYDIVPTALEKTMSPAQLYKANNTLWMTGFGVETIRIISILEEKLGQDTVADDCIDEFMSDCKHGMRPITALEKQLRKQNSLERAYQSWIRRN